MGKIALQTPGIFVLLYKEIWDVPSSDSCSSAKTEIKKKSIVVNVRIVCIVLFVVFAVVQRELRMCQSLTTEELFSLFICLGKAVENESLVSARVRHQLILHHPHQQLVIQKT